MKNKPFVIFISLVLIYVVYKAASFLILNSQITDDTIKPKIKLSQLVTISEERVKYNQSFYFNNDFIGFNAFIDKKYFITVTKLGRVSKGYKIIKSDKKLKYSSDIYPFDSSFSEYKNSRYIDDLRRKHVFKE